MIPGFWEGEQGGDGLHILFQVLQDAVEPLHAQVSLLIMQGVRFLSQPKPQPVVQGCLDMTSTQSRLPTKLRRLPGKELSAKPST